MTYCLEFPLHCVTYRGQNPLACYDEIWLSVGCLKEGYGVPNNLTRNQLAVYHRLDLG